MSFLRFPLDRGKAFIRHYASSSEKSPVCLRCSVVNALATLRLHYQLFSAMRSSRWSERKSSKLLLVRNVRFRASFRRRKCRFYAFLLTEEKLLYGITPPLPKKVPFAYHLCAVKRFSLCSKRKRSELLFDFNGMLRASFLCFRLNRISAIEALVAISPFS